MNDAALPFITTSEVDDDWSAVLSFSPTTLSKSFVTGMAVEDDDEGGGGGTFSFSRRVKDLTLSTGTIGERVVKVARFFVLVELQEVGVWRVD